MAYFRDDLDHPPPRRPSHYFDREDYYSSRDRYDYERDLGPGLGLGPGPGPGPSFRDRYKDTGADSRFVTFGSVGLELVNPFDPKPRRRPKPPSCRTVFVGSLPDTCTESHLGDLFSNCGSILEMRVSKGKNFGHVQFTSEGSVERALQLSGCTVRINNSYAQEDMSRIHVDYAQDKHEADLKKRMEKDDFVHYSTANVAVVTNDLHQLNSFSYAAKNVIHWLNLGTVDASATLYGLVATVNSHGRKFNKLVQTNDEEEFELQVKKKMAHEKLLSDSEVMIEVFETAPKSKVWSNFTKGQRKTVVQWKDQAEELRDKMKAKIEEDNELNRSEPPSKMRKVTDSDDTKLEADLDRAKREIEQLTTDREVAIEKKDKQILQLKTLLAKFKKTCPEEWEKALGVTSASKKKEDSDTKEEEMDGMETSDNGAEEGESEIIEGVSLDDLNAVMAKDASENSLASAAAAYAKMRKTVGSVDMAGSGLSEAEVAIVSVLAAFLTVHPLGATIESITAYFQTFNPAYNSYYLESLLRRLTKVFQLSGEGGGKWWFLGFQTCYATPASAKSEKMENSK